MSKRNIIIFSIAYLLTNSLIFWLNFTGIFEFQGSINMLLGMMCANILGTESYLIGSIVYLPLSTLIFYGLAQVAFRKFEIVILLLLVLVITLPLLNFNGL